MGERPQGNQHSRAADARPRAGTLSARRILVCASARTVDDGSGFIDPS
jgi:hypothetical protein